MTSTVSIWSSRRATVFGLLGCPPIATFRMIEQTSTGSLLVSDKFNDDDSTKSHPVWTKGATIAHYRIVEKIGSGGMGEVYLADDTKLNRSVALKLLPYRYLSDDNVRERFKREAQAAAALDHPSIVTIYDVGEDKSQPFFAMQYIEGETVRDQIARKVRPQAPDMLKFAVRVCKGLREAHQQKITHRDIKPANIMIDKDGRPKLLDFGLATIEQAEKLTRTGLTMGTVGYMSPEQVRGEKVDGRTDIFALGAVLYELVTGHSPFQRESEGATLNAVLNEIPESLRLLRPDLPPNVCSIIEKAIDKDLQTRYQTIADMLADLRNEQKLILSTATRTRSVVLPDEKSGWDAKWRISAWASLVTAAVILLLVFQPWQDQTKNSQQLSAAENRLAIMSFDNLAEPADINRLGEIAASLLITDLSESHYVECVSSQRIHEILRNLGQDDIVSVDQTIVAIVAKEAAATWMLLGQILQVEPSLVLASNLVDVASGTVIASQMIPGDVGETIFAIIDRLTVEIKKDLSLPAAAQDEPDPMVADVTTHSQEAFRYYLEGLDYEAKLYVLEAVKSFHQALALDSTFAMVYYWLAWIEDPKYIEKAVQYSEQATEKEKHYIKGLQARLRGDFSLAIGELTKVIERYPNEKEALYWMGNISHHNLKRFDDAVAYLKRAVAIDSLYKEPYNVMAYAYNELGNIEQSITAINHYISLAPKEANPYDSRGDLYALNGRVQEAIDSYQQAVQIKPDFYLSLSKLGYMNLFALDYAAADSCFRRLSSAQTGRVRSEGRTYQAIILIYQGHLDSALRIIEDGLVADRMDGEAERWNADKHYLKSCIYRARGEMELSVSAAKICVDIRAKEYPDDPVNMRDVYISLLAETGDLDEAERMAQKMREGLEQRDRALLRPYWMSMSAIARARGDAAEALRLLVLARKESTSPPFQLQYLLASAYLNAGRLGEAVAELESAISRYDESKATSPIWAVKAHYLLGLAYEKSGWTAQAANEYKTFLNLWQNADDNIPELGEARARLVALNY